MSKEAERERAAVLCMLRGVLDSEPEPSITDDPIRDALEAAGRIGMRRCIERIIPLIESGKHLSFLLQEEAARVIAEAAAKAN